MVIHPSVLFYYIISIGNHFYSQFVRSQELQVKGERGNSLNWGKPRQRHTGAWARMICSCGYPGAAKLIFPGRPKVGGE